MLKDDQFKKQLAQNKQSNFCFRAYLTNLLTYGLDSKNSFLQNQGFYLDTVDKFDPVDANGITSNQGFRARCAWFRQDFKLENEWRPEGNIYIYIFIYYIVILFKIYIYYLTFLFIISFRLHIYWKIESRTYGM